MSFINIFSFEEIFVELSDEEEEVSQIEEKKEEIEENSIEEQNQEKFFTEITPENINELNDYKANNLDDSEDKWKTYLYIGINGELRKRLDEMIMKSEYKDFFEGLKYEYGFGVEKDLKKALTTYLKSAILDSKNYLSMTRLYDIFRNDYNKFNIKKDKNLEMAFLFKSIAYYPLATTIHNSNVRFPLNPISSLLMFLQNNLFIVDQIEKKILSYIDELMKVDLYRKIISQKDCNLIKGFIEGFLWSYDIGGSKTSYDTLIALSYENFDEATFKLASIYLNQLKKIKEKENEKNDKDKEKEKENPLNKEELITKIYDLFQLLVENKYYPAYADCGYFLFNEMGMFDEALQILKEGYEHNQYNCAIYYFHAFTKSDNLKIYDPKNFDKNKFIDITQALIDSFILGQTNSLHNLFDFIYIIGKKYDLKKELSFKYMNYLNEIAELCLSFIDIKNGENNCKRYSPIDIDDVKHSAYHALGFIYMYGLTTKYKKDLFKAENYIKEAIKYNEASEPFYTRLLYKIKHKLFNVGAIEDGNELKLLEKKVFNLYEKNKDYEFYGNSYYYYFGRLYEYGIGTKKDLNMAYSYYSKGCNPLHHLFDSFIIVYKRYLSLKKVDLEKFDHLNPNKMSKIKYNVIFRLSTGKSINLLINEKMKINQIKNELYKKQDLQRLRIKCFLFGGETLKNSETIGKYEIKKDQVVLVMVDDKSEIMSTG